MKITKNKKGAMGIGTLIIFIAIVLVAAVAATVLITTSSTMQRRAYDTSKNTLHQVSTNLDIISVAGISTTRFNPTMQRECRNETGYNVSASANYASAVSDKINETIITLKLSPGAEDIDMNKMIIVYQTGNVTIEPISYLGFENSTWINVTNDASGWNCTDVCNTNLPVCSLYGKDNRTIINDLADYTITYIETSESVEDNMLEAGETVELHFWIEDTTRDYSIGVNEQFKITIIPEVGIPTTVEVTTPGRIEKVYTHLYP